MTKTGASYTAARAQPLVADALHVTNGDSAAGSLRKLGLAPVLAWRDALHDGPVPDVPDDELRAVRAEFLTGPDADAVRDAQAILVERDATLDAQRDGAYVLWFEADLYDQLQIAQILARLASLAVPAGAITLICIGEHLGIARFGGLGELRPDQLGELPFVAATPLTDPGLRLASDAWAALRVPEPGGLRTIAAARSGELRFMGEAFDRLSREYPSTRDGLSLVERRLLAAVAEGAQSAGKAFIRAMAREARPYLGDALAWRALERLAGTEAPLLATDPVGPIGAATRLAITEAGRRVLAGADDHVALNGIDRWIGGVHLAGREVRWRWDEGVEAIVDSQARR
jgi:Domain of unknown function (DUF1835)